MGWSSEHRAKGSSNQDWFASKLDCAGGKVLDVATVGSTCYIAYQVQEDEQEYVTALVALINWNYHQYNNFSHKLMPESMGPAERRCPGRILKQLSPLEDLGLEGRSLEWASEWRQDCQDRLKAKKSRGKLSSGDQIIFQDPIRFTDGQEAQCFQWVKGNRFYRLVRNNRQYHSECLVSISGWRERNWAKL